MDASWTDRAQARMARTVFGLPRGLARVLAGKPIVVDREPLDPHLALTLRAQRIAGRPGLDQLGVDGARDEYRLMCELTDVEPPPLPVIHETSIPGPAGPIPVRLYRPRPGDAPLPVILFFHGGGFVIGDLDSHDIPCRRLALGTDSMVVAVEYRLAPEHPFPAAVEDAVAAFRWMAAHAAELQGDPAHIAVMGDSAGANLATVICQQTRDGGPRPELAVLVYPVTDMSMLHPSRELFDHGFVLEGDASRWFEELYAGSAERSDPRLSPLCASSLAGLPPHVVTTAGFDPLRDEGEAYVKALRSAGVEVTHLAHEHLTHAWFCMGRIPACNAALQDCMAAIGEARASLGPE